MALFLVGGGLQAVVIAMFMNSDNRIHFIIAQFVDGVVHLSNREVPKSVEWTVVKGLAQGAFQCKAFNPDPSIYRCELHYIFPLFGYKEW